MSVGVLIVKNSCLGVAFDGDVGVIGVGVEVGVAVDVGVRFNVNLPVGVRVGVAVEVLVGVGVIVGDGVRVDVGIIKGVFEGGAVCVGGSCGV